MKRLINWIESDNFWITLLIMGCAGWFIICFELVIKYI